MSTLRWTRTQILDALQTGIERGSEWEWAPQLSDNYISGVDYVGKNRTPVLLLSLANGQHFEIRVKEARQ